MLRFKVRVALVSSATVTAVLLFFVVHVMPVTQTSTCQCDAADNASNPSRNTSFASLSIKKPSEAPNEDALIDTGESDFYTIPDDDTLQGLNDTVLSLIYWRYINTIQVLCRNQMRVGSMRDGGKEICIDKKYKPRNPCLVYSFGSNYDFEFEKHMFDRYQCEIHTFDPSINPQVQVPEYVIFHKIGLGGKDSTVGPDKFDVRRFSTIVKQLDHEKRHIDILKIDIEGWEWAALSDIFVNGGLSRVRQLSLEIHFGTISDYQPKRKRMLTINSLQSLRKLLAADGSNDGKKRAIVHQITDKSNVDGMKKEVENMREQYKDKRAKGIELWSNDKKDSGFAHGNIATEEHEGVWGGVSFAFQLKVLRQLYEHGFRIFMREHNTFRVQTLPKPFWTFSNVNELSFLNLYDQFGSFDM